MTFDTFDTYNTDEAYKDKGTTAKGLVAAYKKDNPNGTKEDFYSKLNKTWAQDKDGHVKNAVDEAFKVETPKTEEKVAETKTETTAPKTETSNISKSDKDFMNNQFAIIDEAKRKTINDALNEKTSAYKNTMDTLEKQGAAYKNIEDHYIEQLPTFMIKRYANGEFGDPKSSDAKLRLAHFMINGIQSKLKNASNAAAIAAGRSPMFADTTSDYEKLQQTNLEQGLENRWNKYKTETNNAMTILNNRGYKEEELTDALRTISQNQNLQTAFNMVDENKKTYMLEVITELGNKIGNMNDKGFVNLMLGMANSGTVDPTQAAEMIGIRAGGSLASKYNLFDENGNIDLSVIKNLVANFGKDKAGSFLKEYGIDIDSLDYDMAGIGLGGSGGSNNPDSVIDEKKTNSKLSNPTGNVKGYKALDGNTYDFKTFESKAGKEKLIGLINDLDSRFYNGEINAETYRKYRQPLYEEAGRHTGIKASKTEDALKANVTLKLKDLNDATKKGKVTIADYRDATSKILEMANDVGMTEKEIEKLKGDFKKESSIKYKGPDK